MFALIIAVLETVRNLGMAAMERYIFHDKYLCKIHIERWKEIVEPLLVVALLEGAYSLCEHFYGLLVRTIEGA